MLNVQFVRLEVAAIPEDATANAIPFFPRISANIKLRRNVFPVPRGASKKINL